MVKDYLPRLGAKLAKYKPANIGTIFQVNIWNIGHYIANEINLVQYCFEYWKYWMKYSKSIEWNENIEFYFSFEMNGNSIPEGNIKN